MVILRAGDFVVDFPGELKFVAVSMEPRTRPWDVTLDEILVMSKPAVKGLTRSTVTWLMLFVINVVGRTV